MILMLVTATGCGSRPTPAVLQDGRVGEAAPARPKAVDLLLVVDNSPSMGEEQQLLVEAFPALLEALRDPAFGADSASNRPCTGDDPSGCNLPPIHLGVVSPDLGAGGYDLPLCEGDGARLQGEGCVPGAAWPFANTAGPGAAPHLKQTLACLVDRLGTSGCAFDQPLEAARRALDPAQGRNAGFLRDEALLVLLVLTNLDDCSVANARLFDPGDGRPTDPLGPLSVFRCFDLGIACDINDRWKIGPRQNCRPGGDWLHSIDGYAAFLRGLKPTGHVILGVIAGPTDSVFVGRMDVLPSLYESCHSATGLAGPAIRLEALTDALAPDSQFSSVCAESYAPALQGLGQKILAKLAR